MSDNDFMKKSANLFENVGDKVKESADTIKEKVVDKIDKNGDKKIDFDEMKTTGQDAYNKAKDYLKDLTNKDK